MLRGSEIVLSLDISVVKTYREGIMTGSLPQGRFCGWTSIPVVPWPRTENKTRRTRQQGAMSLALQR
jgi:hypothetical protein